MADLLPDAQTDLTYTDALRRLLSLVDFERMAGTTASAFKNDLGRMHELAERAGGPSSAPVVHVAGTKGKGSVAAVTSSILRAAGLRVGVFTSPHLHTFRERFSLDGDPVTEVQFARALERVWPHVLAMEAESPYGAPTTFEALTAMAFELFRAHRVDVQVIEVGLGGRLDSTNVVESAVSVITSVSLDHTSILGGTVAEIAAEKAGIVKGAAPVVVAPQLPEAMAVIRARAEAMGARLVAVGEDVIVEARGHTLAEQRFTVQTASASYDLRSPLLGPHQQENVAVAVAAVEALGSSVAPTAIVEGVARVRWDGRFQVLSAGTGGPVVVVDGAHNPHSTSRLRETVAEYVAPERTVVVFGCSGDKDLQAIVEELARFADAVVIASSRHPRALDPAKVAAAFERAGVRTRQADGIPEALEMAQRESGPHDLVLVTGSLFVVAEALEAWYGIEAERYPELDPNERMVGGGRP